MNILKKKRADKEMTQAQLAKESGVNIRQIQRYEAETSSTNNMTLINAYRICKVLECSMEELIELESKGQD